MLVHRGQHLVAVNLSTEAQKIVLETPSDPGGRAEPAERQVVLAWDPTGSTLTDGVLTLPPESAVVLGPAR